MCVLGTCFITEPCVLIRLDHSLSDMQVWKSVQKYCEHSKIRSNVALTPLL
jgi:hypothetical protein